MRIIYLFIATLILVMNIDFSESMSQPRYRQPFDRHESEEIRKCLVLVGAFGRTQVQREAAYFLLDEMRTSRGVLSVDNEVLLALVITHYYSHLHPYAHFGYATGRPPIMSVHHRRRSGKTRR